MVNQTNIPGEFDIIKTEKGFTMKGWDFTRADLAEAVKADRMLNPTFELASNVCPWDCDFCFTEDPSNPKGLKKRLNLEMSLEERLKLINDANDLGVRSINIVGAGEPTIDPNFWQLMEHISNKAITPIVYTEGTLRLTDEEFTKRLYSIGATIVLKVNSLENSEYQNAVVNSGERRTHPLKIDYFQKRNEALQILLDLGFNKHDPTRLAFDTIICRENYDEVLKLHRYTRDNNIFVLAVGYLPTGRSSNLDKIQGAISPKELLERYQRMAEIDENEYGIKHGVGYPYGGGVPCSIRGRGLHVKIQGDVMLCPGEFVPIGNLKTESLKDIWYRTKEERIKHNWGCPPRIVDWKQRGYDTSELK